MRQTELERAVSDLIGYDPWEEQASRQIHASIRQQGDTLVASFEVIDAEGKARGMRTLSGSTGECDELVRSIALAISLTVDPLALQRRERASQDKQADRSERTWHVAASGGLTVGALPDIGAGASLHASMRTGWWSLGVEGQFLGATRSDRANIELSTWKAGAMGSACAHFGISEVCPLAGLSVIGATGRGLRQSRLRTQVVPSAGLRLGVYVPLSALWHIALRTDLRIPITRTVLRDDTGAVEFWRAPAVGLMVTAGIMRTFR